MIKLTTTVITDNRAFIMIMAPVLVAGMFIGYIATAPPWPETLIATVVVGIGLYVGWWMYRKTAITRPIVMELEDD
jgi:hydrogenase/urease accessory protein HupE